MMKTDHPRTALRYCERPIRLWDVRAKRCLSHRCFKFERRAHDAAIAAINWLPAGSTLEVYNARTGKLLGQYTKRPGGIIKTWLKG